MSYLICRMQKFTAGAVTGIQIHNRREKESRTNPGTDKDKKSENIYLESRSKKSYKHIIDERIKKLDLKKAVRKDAVVMCEFVVTSDSKFFERLTKKQQLDFFQDVNKFLQERYGKENLVDISIHNDEKTPHMHIGFIPVTEDGRLSAKSIFTPTHLKNLQTEIFEKVGKTWYGLERGQEGSKAKHIKTEDLKLTTMKNNFVILKKAYEDLSVKHKKLEELDKKNQISDFFNKLEKKLNAETKRADMAEQKFNDFFERVKKVTQDMGIEKEFNMHYNLALKRNQERNNSRGWSR